MHAARALYVEDDITVICDGGTTPLVRTTPEDIGTFPELLHRFGRVAAAAGLDEMTVLLDRKIVGALGFPVKPPVKGADRHPLMEAARAHRWVVKAMGPWMTFRGLVADRPTVHIGILPWLHDKNFLLWDEQGGNSAYLCARIQQLTGTAYRSKPGIVGSAMLQDQWRGAQPMWHPNWEHCPPALDHVTEQAYSNWTPDRAADEGKRFRHSYDLRRNYLAGAVVSESSFGPLKRSPLREFNRKIAGYWQVITPAWNDSRLPHPMGPNRVAGQTVWVTTPTLALLEDLQAEGLIAMPDVLDSWIAPMGTPEKPFVNTRRILRQWAQKIDNAASDALDSPIKSEGLILETAIKAMYKEAFGMWVNPTSRIWRPDISHTVIAYSRVNKWRKLHTAATLYGFYPERVHVDEVTYASDVEDWYEARPNNFKVGEKLGMFKDLPKTLDVAA